MALSLCGCVVTAIRGILLHLTENPGVSGGGAPDHDGVAAGFADHALGVFRSVDIAIADHWNLHRLLHGGDDTPIGGAGVALLACPGMYRNDLYTNAFCHFRDIHRYNRVFVPTRSQLDRKWDANGGTNGSENVAEQRKIPQQAGAAALDDFLGRAAQIDVHGVVAEVFDHAGGIGHDLRICAEELRGDGMLVFLKIEITERLGGAAGDAFGAGELRHEQAATAEAANDAAEKRVRHASHRGKHRGGADGQVANLKRSG